MIEGISSRRKSMDGDIDHFHVQVNYVELVQILMVNALVCKEIPK